MKRVSARRLVIDPMEQGYVLGYWPLLGRLRQLLRTERKLRMAVLFGSVARGEDGPDFDLDILVTLSQPDYLYLAGLQRRLREALGREVQLMLLDQAERSPSLLTDAIEDGRVLVDRDDEWPKLRRRYPRLARAAATEDRDLESKAALAINEILAEA